MLNVLKSGAGWSAMHHNGVWIAIIVTLVFAIVARLVRGVSTSGAIAGAVISFVLFASLGPSAFVALVCLFVLTWLATRLGYGHKQTRGTAERRDGRTASQVLANLGVAGAGAVLFVATGSELPILVVIAALSEAAADTLSSEYGQAVSDRAVLITTWESVPAGTDGGISLLGTVAGIGGASVITAVCVGGNLLGWRWFWIPVLAATLGMVIDSFLGAWLERKGILNNDAVNFLGTMAAAVMVAILWIFMGR